MFDCLTCCAPRQVESHDALSPPLFRRLCNHILAGAETHLLQVVHSIPLLTQAGAAQLLFDTQALGQLFELYESRPGSSVDRTTPRHEPSTGSGHVGEEDGTGQQQKEQQQHQQPAPMRMFPECVLPLCSRCLVVPWFVPWFVTLPLCALHTPCAHPPSPPPPCAQVVSDTTAAERPHCQAGFPHRSPVRSTA